MDAPEQFEFYSEVTRRDVARLLLVFALPAGEPLSRFEFHTDGSVTVFTGKVELGQGPRTLITQLVADEFGLPPDKVKVLMADTDKVPDDGGTYGSLTTPEAIPAIRKACAEAREKLKEKLPNRPTGKWLGESLPNVNGRAIVTGALKYSSDVKVAGMIEKTVPLPETYNGKTLVTDIYAYFRSTAKDPDAKAGGRYPAVVQQGDLAEGWKLAAQKHESTYTLPYIAHAPLEPRAAIAEWKGDHVTVWCGTQTPFLVRKELSDALEIPVSHVRLIVSDTGSGFGGKHRGEVELQAARLARQEGRPVRVAWSREQEFTGSYFRPAGVVDVRSGVDKDGRLVAWDHHNFNSGASSLRPQYVIPHYFCSFHRADSPLRQGSYRSLAAVANTFARESHVDEWAHKLKADPLEFRLRNTNDSRLKEVLQRGAERFGWAKRKGGVACNLEKDAYLALFVEMDGVRVKRAVMAFDPGWVLNPDNLKNQITGAIVQGIGGAMFEKVRFDEKRVLNPRFSSYRVPRFADIPEIEVLLISRREIAAAGAGEAPITVVAPAIAAAIFRRTGKRLRDLPFEDQLR